VKTINATIRLVGVNNHRQFVVFVITLIVGIIAFDSLTIGCKSEPFVADTISNARVADIGQLPPPTPSADGKSSLCDFHPNICAMSSTPDATFALAVALWATLQLTWTPILLAGQLIQIARQMTTFEVSNITKFGFMGGGGDSLAMQQGHQHTGAGAGVSGEEDDPSTGHGHVHAGHRHRHGHSHGAKGFGFLLRLLGLDRFTRGNAARALARANQSSNPFDVGIIANCSDFWNKGKEMGVQYESLYEVPPRGFHATKTKREERDDEDAGSHIGNGKRRGSVASRFVPAFIANMRRPSNQYQAIAMSEDV